MLGTPHEGVWNDVTKLKDFKPTFPKWAQNTLPSLCTKISPEGVDLLGKMLQYDPIDRITP